LTQPSTQVQSKMAGNFPNRKYREMFKTKKVRPAAQPDGEQFTSMDVARVCGVSLRQLQWWDERSVVSPRQDGHKRVYLPQEVLEVSVIAELRRKGFSLQKIRRVLRFLQKDMGKRLSEALQSDSDVHLLTDGKSIYLEDAPDRIINLLKNARQPMFLVCVSDQVRRLSHAMKKPPKSEGGRPVRKVRAI
jgi:DNA-binding transcriptional MerR regulator